LSVNVPVVNGKVATAKNRKKVAPKSAAKNRKKAVAKKNGKAAANSPQNEPQKYNQGERSSPRLNKK
jgi:hypothetical protein